MTMTGEKGGAVAFFDVDGTLVWHDEEKVASGEYDFSSATPTPAVYEAFHRLHVAGHRAFIGTGRPVPFILDSLRALEPDGYIAAAGAYVQVGDTVVRDASIPNDLLLETVRRFVDAGIDLMLESNTQSVEVRPSGAPAEFASSGLVRSADELGGFLRDHRFAKFCVSGCPLEALAPVLPFCERHFTIADLQFGTHEFSLRGVNKGSAIEAVLAYLGLPRKSAFAFGDSENDLPMAPAVGTFVAMGNALPVVRERADYVTDPVEKDGVPSALRHLGLI